MLFIENINLFITIGFSLDMDIVVFMDYVNDIHVPTDVYYNGFWNVFLFKPE